MLAVVVDRDDVLVAEIAGGAGLASEAGQQGGIAERGEQFDGDVPVHHRVVGAIDDAEPAASDLAQDLVSADSIRHSVSSSILHHGAGFHTRQSDFRRKL